MLNYRVAGVCLRGRDLLLEHAPSEDFWALPGGRVELGETSVEALVRELDEELGVAAVPGRLLWVNENFFEQAGRPWHELGLYYLTALPAAGWSATGRFAWHPLDASAPPSASAPRSSRPRCTRCRPPPSTSCTRHLTLTGPSPLRTRPSVVCAAGVAQQHWTRTPHQTRTGTAG